MSQPQHPPTSLPDPQRARRRGEGLYAFLQKREHFPQARPEVAARLDHYLQCRGVAPLEPKAFRRLAHWLGVAAWDLECTVDNGVWNGHFVVRGHYLHLASAVSGPLAEAC